MSTPALPHGGIQPIAKRRSYQANRPIGPTRTGCSVWICRRPFRLDVESYAVSEEYRHPPRFYNKDDGAKTVPATMVFYQLYFKIGDAINVDFDRTIEWVKYRIREPVWSNNLGFHYDYRAKSLSGEVWPHTCQYDAPFVHTDSYAFYIAQRHIEKYFRKFV